MNPIINWEEEKDQVMREEQLSSYSLSSSLEDENYLEMQKAIYASIQIEEANPFYLSANQEDKM